VIPVPDETATPLNYVDVIARSIGEIAPDCPLELLRLYALLALTTGERT
jgi:hypothetical protein